MPHEQNLRLSLAQLDPLIGDMDYNINLLLEAVERAKEESSDLVITPELFLGGYSATDILTNPDYQKALSHIIDRLCSASRKGPALLVGAPVKTASGLENSFLFIHEGQCTSGTGKHHLAHDSVFDEKRNFSPCQVGPEPVSLKGVKLGVIICNDIWFPDRITEAQAQGAEIIIVLNSSPFAPGKHEERVTEIQKRVDETGLGILYVNQVGGYDSLIYDGGSFIVNPEGGLVGRLSFFTPDFQTISFSRKENRPQIEAGLPLSSLPSPEEALYRGAMTALSGYMAKNGFSSVILGLSGGLDSAFTALLASDFLGGEKVKALLLPSPLTSEENIADARLFASKACLDFDSLAIGDIMQAMTKTITHYNPFGPETGLAFENMQARIRAVLLMSLANQHNLLLLATGNKSELATGYTTLYGDLCGGYAPIADLYKTQIYKLAKWRNAHRPDWVKGGSSPLPVSFLTKAPSAELRPDQTDQDSLPPYEVLDAILEGLVEQNLSEDALVERGFAREVVTDIFAMVERSEYKRQQAPPAPKLSRRAFRTERRYPLTSALYRRNLS